MKNDTCKHCGEDLTEFPENEGVCDECEDNLCAIERGEFHDPDLMARDKEERAWFR